VNARSINAAAGVVQAAWKQGRRTAVGIALALDSAQMLMSPETAAELARLREERHSTNESVSEAAEALRVQRDRIDGLESTNAALRARLAVLEGQRAALAERLRAGQTWRQGRLVSEDVVSQSELREVFGIPLAAPLDGITRLIAPLQALRETELAEDVSPQVAKLRDLLAGQRAAVEDPHDSPLHHSYRVPRDLPPLDGGQ
jgi:septal ring factor EnvC (AmiA/AmiB activator)